MPGKLSVIGIRHHSPACARLVRQQLAALKPKYVLIEGPSDYNPRMAELLLAHQLPIALYSFNSQPGLSDAMTQCWFPLLDYSPEWVALRDSDHQQQTVRFIDLPHWQYRTLADQAKRVGESDGRERYRLVTNELKKRFHCDSDDALWDHLFEASPLEELSARLEHYFALLRGDPTRHTHPQDAAREQFMARYIVWALSRAQDDETVLVICGGWHKAALEAMVRQMPHGDEFTAQPQVAQSAVGKHEPQVAQSAVGKHEPQVAQSAVGEHEPVAEPAGSQATVETADTTKAGSYLIPYEFRQVDALAGYASGMQSPTFYQWVWEADYATAVARAREQIVTMLRQKKQTVSTADLIALQYTEQMLASLRGHSQTMRTDLLDALQSSLVKDSLDRPPPWSEPGLLGIEQHPILREAMLVLTGVGAGKLHADTPLPPLLRQVEVELATHQLQIGNGLAHLALDRRNKLANEQAVVLWRLQCLGLSSVKLKETRAPNAARALPQDLYFEEYWALQRNTRWFAELIEASAYGATLASASLAKLKERAHAHQSGPASIVSMAACLKDALRAGFGEYADELVEGMNGLLPHVHQHGELAQAIESLQAIEELGFFDQPILMLDAPLQSMLAHLLWLVDGLQHSSQAQTGADVRAIACLYRHNDRAPHAALRSRGAEALRHSIGEGLSRTARRRDAPAALRGAACGAAFRLQILDPGGNHRQVLGEICQSMPARDQLGDYLYGFFSLARQTLMEDASLMAAIFAAIANMGDEEFVVALPQLRAGFAWFPPRERAQLAEHIAPLLGIEKAAARRLLSLPNGVERFFANKQLEAWVDQWALAHGVAFSAWAPEAPRAEEESGDD